MQILVNDAHRTYTDAAAHRRTPIVRSGRSDKMPVMNAALERAILDSGLDPEACALRHVARASRLIVASFDAALRPVGLSGHQFNVLMTLARRETLNVNGLAAAVGMHPSTTPRLIAPLIRYGWVRTQPGIDQRERFIVITSKGLARLVRAYPLWADIQRKVVGHLGDRRWSSTTAALRSIRKSLTRTQDEDGGP
jgi:DNA-binding MarR family transcriptional regulator